MSNGHGWVIPTPSGAKARCGGPALCQSCREELESMQNAERPTLAIGVASPRPASYIPPASSGLTFDVVLGWLKGGRKVTRKGWNGKGMYIYLIPSREMSIGDSDETTPLVGVKAEGIKVTYATRVDMQYANGEIGVWTPTFDDIFATDWSLLN